jgi:hypothetical protein
VNHLTQDQAIYRPKTWKPVAAGIINFIGGAYIVFSLVIGLFNFAIFLNDEADKMENILFPLTAIVSSAIIIFHSFCLTVLASLAIVSGVIAIRRKVWSLALTGSIAVFVASLSLFAPFINLHLSAWIIAPILGIATVILIALSKKEFA